MIFDTDILIWIQRGNLKAAKFFDDAEARYLSAQSYLELMQYAQSREELRKTKAFLRDLELTLIPLTENISHRAMVYMEEYGFTSGLGSGDALIAATAVEQNRVLATGNAKHFRAIQELQLKIFRP